MKWIARLLAPVLLFVCMATPIRPAEAATDDELAAISRMQTLGLVQGQGDGDLALDAFLTRAEMMTIFVRAFGHEGTVPIVYGASTFTDTENHWSSGYVTVANNLVRQASNGQQGLGYPDGSFRPDATVTSAEAVAFLVKFLGIESVSAKSWPDNYLSAAASAGLISLADADRIRAIANEPARRGPTFVILDFGYSNYHFATGGTVYTTHTEKPVITVDRPPFVDSAKHTITGTVSPKPQEVRVGGVLATLDGERFSATVTLAEGSNTVKVEAIGIAGHVVVSTVDIFRQPVRSPQQPTVNMRPSVTAVACTSTVSDHDDDTVEITCSGTVSNEGDHVLAWVKDEGYLCPQQGNPCVQSTVPQYGTFTVEFSFVLPDQDPVTIHFAASSSWGLMSDVVTRTVALPERID